MRAVRIEEAAFAVDEAMCHVDGASRILETLSRRLQSFLPVGLKADLARSIDEIVVGLRALKPLGDALRNEIMDSGMPSDDAACTSCGSVDFSNDGCEACAEVRSDGLRLATRMAGWNV